MTSQPTAISSDLFRISALQKEDLVCITLHSWISSGEFPSWIEVKGLSPELRSLWHHRNNQSPLLQLLIPKPGREQLFLSYHASLFGGHLGRNRTLAQLAHRFYWSGMSDDVKEWLQQCVVCVKRKFLVGRIFRPVTVGIVSRWTSWMCMTRRRTDIVYILVIADYFSKWTEAFPIKNKCADMVADVLVEKIIYHSVCLWLYIVTRVESLRTD